MDSRQTCSSAHTTSGVCKGRHVCKCLPTRTFWATCKQYLQALMVSVHDRFNIMQILVAMWTWKVYFVLKLTIAVTLAGWSSNTHVTHWIVWLKQTVSYLWIRDEFMALREYRTDPKLGEGLWATHSCYVHGTSVCMLTWSRRCWCECYTSSMAQSWEHWILGE